MKIFNFKQFSINEDITAGHTIVYHRTKKENLDSIIKNGFKLSNRNAYGSAILFYLGFK